MPPLQAKSSNGFWRFSCRVEGQSRLLERGAHCRHAVRKCAMITVNEGSTPKRHALELPNGI